MKVLLTGFEPFNGEGINPAWELVQAVTVRQAKCELFKLKLPTAYDVASQLVCEKIAEIQPDYVISVGQAGGTSCLHFEYVALNLQAANIPDNLGQRRDYQAIDPLGPTAYFATLAVRQIVDKLKTNKVPAALSLSAGTFVCNDVFYGALHYCATHDLKTKCSFLHVPYLPEQVAEKPKTSSMSLEQMKKGLELALTYLSEEEA